MNIQEHIRKMKNIEDIILDFIDNDDNTEEVFQNIFQEILESNIIPDRHNLKTIFYLLSHILNNHHRNQSFIEKIEQIFTILNQQIKEYFTSDEIYKIFRKNPRFILFLIKTNIIEIDKDIINNMGIPNYIYLFPKAAKRYELINIIPENYKEKQKIGENDNLICELIRNDLIEEFITYVNRNDYPLKNKIASSIFETNYFLLKHKHITLIEYATFFGSTQIVKYLYKNGVELTSSLWIYAIHSDNPEMIYILEENHIKPPNNSYDKCIKESIKCHHNDITNYILSNLIDEDIQSINHIDFKNKYDENIYSYSFRYCNFKYFPQKINEKIFFFYACQYDYFQIVEFLLKTINIDIKEEII